MRAWRPATGDRAGLFTTVLAPGMPRILLSGSAVMLGFGALEVAIPEVPEDLVALDEALNKLRALDKLAADLVQLRFFAGLPLPEVAQLLGISPRTADRLWAYARAWLHQEIQGGSPTGDIS